MRAQKGQTSRVALVTGANRGIGYEIARQLAAKGVKVLVGSRDPKAGREAAERFSKENGQALAVAVKLDVTRQGDVTSLVKRVRSDFGGLDILVNNAGVLLDEEDLPSRTEANLARETFEVNVIGPWRLYRAFAPQMKDRGYGRIVNVSSGAGSFESLSGPPYSPAYSVSKAALNALTLKMASELRGTNVLVNAVHPGWVRTRMGGPRAPRSVEEGAETAVWLATLPDGGPTGGFFSDRKRTNW